MSGGSERWPARPPRNPGLWIGLALGVPVVAYGVAGALHDADLTRPAELARWIVGAALVHDLVFAPVVLGTSWLLGRVAGRRRVPAPLRWALATSAVLVLLAWPLARGYGRDTTIPSLFPRDYATGLLAYVAAVWAVAGAATLVRRPGGRHRP